LTGVAHACGFAYWAMRIFRLVNIQFHLPDWCAK
jgi:hypothetical protein